MSIENIQEKRISEHEIVQELENEFEDLQLNAANIEEGRVEKQRESIFASCTNENLQLNKIRIRRAYFIPLIPKGVNPHRVRNQKFPTKRIWKTIHAFASGNVGTFIVDALDNSSYGIKVGSRFEDLFFSVRCTDMYTKSKNSGFDLVTLFFRNPEAYEAMFFVTLPPLVKANWLAKFQKAETEYVLMMDRIDKQKQYRKQQLSFFSSSDKREEK